MIHDAFRAAIKRSHPTSNISIDEVVEYGGAKLVLYRCETTAYIHHRCAVFKKVEGSWNKENDIIVGQD